MEDGSRREDEINIGRAFAGENIERREVVMRTRMEIDVDVLQFQFELCNAGFF